MEEKQSETYHEPEDTPECLHQFQSALPRNLSVIPNHMLMNKDKKGKAREAGGMNTEETGKSYIFAQNYRSKSFPIKLFLIYFIDFLLFFISLR